MCPCPRLHLHFSESLEPSLTRNCFGVLRVCLSGWAGTGVNGSGLWIFTRMQTRNEAVIQKVRSIALAKGFDLSVLQDINQTSCKNHATF